MPYADAGSEKLRDLVVDVYKRAPDTRIVLLANHGLAASGPTLLEAYNPAEIVSQIKRRRVSVLVCVPKILDVLKEHALRIVRRNPGASLIDLGA